MEPEVRPDGQTDVRSYFQRPAAPAAQQHPSATRSPASVLAATRRPRANVRGNQIAQSVPHRGRGSRASHAEIDIENTGMCMM